MASNATYPAQFFSLMKLSSDYDVIQAQLVKCTVINETHAIGSVEKTIVAILLMGTRHLGFRQGGQSYPTTEALILIRGSQSPVPLARPWINGL